MSRVTKAHVEARRQDILDAATRIFAGRGLANATMAEIAEEAGISPGAIYRYFASKQDLLMCCFVEGAGRIADEWRLKMEQSTDPRDTFVAISRHSFDEITTDGGEDRTRIMLERYLEASRTDSADLAAVTAEREAIVAGLQLSLERMVGANQLPPTSNTDALARALWSFWVGARLSRLIDPRADVDAQLEALVQLIGMYRPA